MFLNSLFPAHAGMIPVIFVNQVRDKMLFPAHAGMILGYILVITSVDAVPRTRGDDPECGHKADETHGCSPHTRG